MNKTYEILQAEDSPVIALALHDGHYIPPDILSHINLNEHERFREEDPYTAFFIADVAATRIVVNTSRFYVDLNRLEAKAIYKQPEDAWGLQVWKDRFPKALEEKLLKYYYKFYTDIEAVIRRTIQQHGYFIILDIHSYNHRRESPFVEADQSENPEINIGTIHNHPKWHPVIERYIALLSKSPIGGKTPDVRENIKFKGGGFSEWVNQHFKEQGYVLSIEFKKTFMDEWTGRGFIEHIQDVRKALRQSVPSLVNDSQSAINS